MLGCRTLRRSDLGQSSAALERVKSLSESGGKVAHATPEPGVLEAILSGQQISKILVGARERVCVCRYT